MGLAKSKSVGWVGMANFGCPWARRAGSRLVNSKIGPGQPKFNRVPVHYKVNQYVRYEIPVENTLGHRAFTRVQIPPYDLW